jgi:hypothetical protein
MCQVTKSEVSSTTKPNLFKSTSKPNHNESVPQSLLIPIWVVVTILSMILAAYIPRLQSQAGRDTFLHAGFNYDEINTFFDNTFLTYGTDYMITVCMLYAAYKCLFATSIGNIDGRELKSDSLGSRDLRISSSLLFLSYGLSVLAGGVAHQFYVKLEDLNSIAFRILWTVCVGCVTAAGGFMGACGSAIYFRLNQSMSQEMVRFRMVHIPYSYWIFYGGCMTIWCILGGISYKRPACDIFVAGTTQFVPTVYVVMTVLSVRWPSRGVTKSPQLQNHTEVIKLMRQGFRLCIIIGFFLNAPLLPMYPLMVQYTSLSLGVVNALLHLNLTFAWGLQAMSVHHFCKRFNLTTENDKRK